MTSGPKWLDVARKYIGLKEVPGQGNNPTILKWWRDIGAGWYTTDATPWCGAYLGGVLKEAGFPMIPKGDGARAKAWLTYGKKLDKPAVGCIVVFDRAGGGHVGFVVGRDQHGNLMVLGGNQSDGVNIKPFARKRILGYRWPSVWPAEHRFNLPVVNSDGKVSTNEA